MKDKVYCEFCEEYHNKETFKRRRMCTRYEDEEKNWLYSCKSQYEEYNENYKDLLNGLYG